jgi:hypothetical protein
VGQVAVVQIDDAVEGPGSGADGPYPCCSTHWRSSYCLVGDWTLGESIGLMRARIEHFISRRSAGASER